MKGDNYEMSSAGSHFDESEMEKSLKRQIISLKAQLETEQARNRRMSGGALLRSEQIDLYPGEQLDFLICVLEQVRARCQQDSRAYDIAESLLSINQPVGIGKEILVEVTRIFKSGLPEKESDIASLQRLGFTYTPSRKHPKLRFHDKYMFVLPSTTSDRRSASRNSLSQISKCIAICQKI